MTERREVEKVYVKTGSDTDSKEPVNVIRGLITGRTFNVPQFTSEKTAWLWRLIPESEVNELKHHGSKRGDGKGTRSKSKSKSKSRR
jgi:hypothetical protein